MTRLSGLDTGPRAPVTSESLTVTAVLRLTLGSVCVFGGGREHHPREQVGRQGHGLEGLLPGTPRNCPLLPLRHQEHESWHPAACRLGWRKRWSDAQIGDGKPQPLASTQPGRERGHFYYLLVSTRVVAVSQRGDCLS